mmetsp:Transcript_34602/g.46399  ORF Transcript_34602/g.46399 Transcript_34602/m.46399 type:complete len:203 (+) Transcript_34602:317-925(+)
MHAWLFFWLSFCNPIHLHFLLWQTPFAVCLAHVIFLAKLRDSQEEDAPSSPIAQGPRRLLEVTGQSEIALQSATTSHRRNIMKNRGRDNTETNTSVAMDSGGSLAASMSATAQHRRQKLSRSSAGAGSVFANPSSISIPIDSSSHSELSENTKTDTTDVESQTYEKEDFEETEQKVGGLNPLIGATVATVALGGSASFWWFG